MPVPLRGDSALARLRLNARLSQVAAAAKLGISVPHLSRTESGFHAPGARIIAAMGEVYGCGVAAVMDAIHRTEAWARRRAHAKEVA